MTWEALSVSPALPTTPAGDSAPATGSMTSGAAAAPPERSALLGP
jgi:hypothetical protein